MWKYRSTEIEVKMRVNFGNDSNVPKKSYVSISLKMWFDGPHAKKSKKKVLTTQLSSLQQVLEKGMKQAAVREKNELEKGMNVLEKRMKQAADESEP